MLVRWGQFWPLPAPSLAGFSFATDSFSPSLLGVPLSDFMFSRTRFWSSLMAAKVACHCFAAAVAHRYGRHGAFWKQHKRLRVRPLMAVELWNEPWWYGAWAPTPDPAAYAALAHGAAVAIRRQRAGVKIVMPGGSGQIGQVLARAFTAGGHEVVILTRGSCPVGRAAASGRGSCG